MLESAAVRSCETASGTDLVPANRNASSRSKIMFSRSSIPTDRLVPCRPLIRPPRPMQLRLMSPRHSALNALHLCSRRFGTLPFNDLRRMAVSQTAISLSGGVAVEDWSPGLRGFCHGSRSSTQVAKRVIGAVRRRLPSARRTRCPYQPPIAGSPVNAHCLAITSPLPP